MSDTDNKPGCFGAATVFSHDSNVCQACQMFDNCGAASLERLNAIKEIVNVKDLLAKHARAQKGQKAIRDAHRQAKVDEAPPPVQESTQKPEVTEPVERKTQVAKVTFEIDESTKQVIARIANQKAAQQAIVLCKSNRIEIARQSLTDGLNPFNDDGPKYLAVAADLLLAGGFTRQSLKDAYQERLGWTPATASSHVSIVVGLLPAFDIAAQEGDNFVLSPLSV